MWTNVKWFVFVAACSLVAAITWPVRWVLSKFDDMD